MYFALLNRTLFIATSSDGGLNTPPDATHPRKLGTRDVPHIVYILIFTFHTLLSTFSSLHTRTVPGFSYNLRVDYPTCRGEYRHTFFKPDCIFALARRIYSRHVLTSFKEALFHHLRASVPLHLCCHAKPRGPVRTARFYECDRPICRCHCSWIERTVVFLSTVRPANDCCTPKICTCC